MIGINVAVRAGAQGIGFAIPVDKVMAVAAELIANCNKRKTSHGMTLAATRGGENAVKVAAVEADSPAAEAGIEPGDVLQSIGDVSVRRPADFQRALLDKRPGEQLKVTVSREGEKHNLSLTLAESQRETRSADNQAAWDVLGLQLKAIPSDDFKQTYQTQYRGGLQVTAVRSDSPAAAQGIRRGDVLVGMHVWETISMENVSYILSRTEFLESSPLKFYILRGSETLYGYIALGPQKAVQE
jgi:serine protease Do